MAYPIGVFNEEAELKKAKANAEKDDVEEAKLSMTSPSVKGLVPPSQISVAQTTNGKSVNQVSQPNL